MPARSSGAFAASEDAIWRREGACSQMHATKPTFYAWSDRRTRSFDQLLTEVMLARVTDTFPTSTALNQGGSC